MNRKIVLAAVAAGVLTIGVLATTLMMSGGRSGPAGPVPQGAPSLSAYDSGAQDAFKPGPGQPAPAVVARKPQKPTVPVEPVEPAGDEPVPGLGDTAGNKGREGDQEKQGLDQTVFRTVGDPDKEGGQEKQAQATDPAVARKWDEVMTAVRQNEVLLQDLSRAVNDVNQRLAALVAEMQALVNEKQDKPARTGRTANRKPVQISAVAQQPVSQPAPQASQASPQAVQPVSAGQSGQAGAQAVQIVRQPARLRSVPNWRLLGVTDTAAWVLAPDGTRHKVALNDIIPGLGARVTALQPETQRVLTTAGSIGME